MPSLDEIRAAREDLVNDLMIGQDGQRKRYNTTKAADRDRLLQAVFDVLSFIQRAKEAAISTDVDRAYLTREEFYKDVPFIFVGRDLWTQRYVPLREELERTYLLFKNAKAGDGSAIGRWRDTAHTGTAGTLGLLTEYTEGYILDTEVWEQSFNDVFLTGVIKACRPVKLVSVLTPRTRKVTLIPPASRPCCHNETAFRMSTLSR